MDICRTIRVFRPADRIVRGIVLTAFVGALGIASGTLAGPVLAQDGYEGFRECQKIDKRKKRFRCYDEVEQRIERQGSSPAPATARVTGPAQATVAAPALAPANTASTEAEVKQDFGLPEPRRKDKARETITVQVVSSTRNSAGHWVFRTDDGQIWRQTNNKFASISGQRFQAEISKAPLTGFYLRPANRKKTRVRVERVK